jgi:hypothetical protein
MGEVAGQAVGVVNDDIGEFTAGQPSTQPVERRAVDELAAVAALCAASYFVSGFMMSRMALGTGWLALAEKALVCTAAATVITFAGLWLTNNGFRMLVRRLLRRRPVATDTEG